MKKIMYFAAVAAVLSLASCAKETLNEDAGTESPVFTATISTGTKTTVDASNGKVAWESTDKITITDAYAASAIYKITSIDGTTGKATFEFESGASLGQGPYTATYGTAPATAQTYAATPCNLYMTAPETSTNSFTFTVQCGLMEINLTKTGESVKSIAVTGTPTGESETTYSLTCTDAVSIAEKKSFYIALPEGSYNKIVITNSEDKVCTLTAASGIALENNHIKPVTLDAGKLNFIPAGALKGKFSVSNDGGTTIKQVYFSQGNLTCDISGATPDWKFYEHQYEYASAYDPNLISLFTWGYDATESIVPNGQASDNVSRTSGNLEQTEDWGCTIGDGNTWRTLTNEEWQYLFNTRTDASSKVGFATVGDVEGIIILPDTFTDPMKNNGSVAFVPKSTTGWTANVYTIGGNWEAMETAGAVFLPAAGRRDGFEVDLVGDYGSYWSSTARGVSHAYHVDFYSDIVYLNEYAYRYLGFSVRLITECQ